MSAVLYGVDIHPTYQAGISIEAIAAEGFGFMACKVSENTDTYDSLNWLRRGKAAGMLCLGYHFLRPGNEVQQAHVFAEQLLSADVAGMLDAEALASDGKTPVLTTTGIRTFLVACSNLGTSVPLLYLPRWYWQRMGSPALTDLPALWASSYVPGSGYASELYAAVTPSYWASYGGLPVSILQFTESGSVAGMTVDCNAYPGTREQLTALLASPSTADPVQGVEMSVIPVQVPPGADTLALSVPVGKASAVTASGWISAMLRGPRSGSVRFWFQNDQGGITELPVKTSPPQALTFANGHSARWVVPIPDGTTMIRADYAFPDGGTVTLELAGKTA